jgi:hypothetical protein
MSVSTSYSDSFYVDNFKEVLDEGEFAPKVTIPDDVVPIGESLITIFKYSVAQGGDRGDSIAYPYTTGRSDIVEVTYLGVIGNSLQLKIARKGSEYRTYLQTASIIDIVMGLFGKKTEFPRVSKTVSLYSEEETYSYPMQDRKIELPINVSFPTETKDDTGQTILDPDSLSGSLIFTISVINNRGDVKILKDLAVVRK